MLTRLLHWMQRRRVQGYRTRDLLSEDVCATPHASAFERAIGRPAEAVRAELLAMPGVCEVVAFPPGTTLPADRREDRVILFLAEGIVRGIVRG